MSNNWQIIYVIFSTVISVEGTNRVANIKPPAEERQKKKATCYKRLMEGVRKREQEERIGGGE